jgi:tRNA nucleotidyltransferase (CCA-adding enzyme)
MSAPDADEFGRRVAALPGIAAIREAAGEVPAFLVGGAVRDLLLGRERTDVDVVVEGDPEDVAARLGGRARSHPQFGTVTIDADGLTVDLAMARDETYERPGALPQVRPAGIAEDLARRDFTVNAIAHPLSDGELLDPHRGRADLERGMLRILHRDSFVDDPTRALRAARYAARFGFGLEAGTERALREADLATVSSERRDAELKKLAAEPNAARGFELLAEWGLVPLPPAAVKRLAAVEEIVSRPPWSGFTDRTEAVLAAVRGNDGEEAEALAAVAPESPSVAVELAHGRSATALALARAAGAEWLDSYVAEWRLVRLEISGEDLLEAGIEEGPAVGAGLGSALRAKLDGEVSGREQELARALEAAR